MVINSIFNTSNKLNRLHKLSSHAQVILKKIGINHGAGNSHGGIPNGQVGFPFHIGYRKCGSDKPENLLFNILWNTHIIGILNISTINSENRESLLSITSQGRGKINSARAFRPVESPNCFGDQRI